MAWIEYHTALRDHWKIQRLADKTQLHYAQALGHVSCLWLWVVDNSPKGSVMRFTNVELCRAARLDSEIPLKKLLKDCELLDAKGNIKDWKKHGIKLLLSSRKRVAEHRKRVTLQKRNGNVTETSTSLSNLSNQPKKAKSVAKLDFNYVKKDNVLNLLKLFNNDKESLKRHLMSMGFYEARVIEAFEKAGI